MRQPVPILFIRIREIVSVGNVLRAYAIRPFSRRAKPISSKFYRLPAAGRRFQKVLIGFPRREGVFEGQRSVSRLILAFPESINHKWANDRGPTQMIESLEALSGLK